MKTADFLRQHAACREGAKWALSISDEMSDVWDELVEQKMREWLIWTATRPGVFSDTVLRKLACRFVRETPIGGGRTVWDLLEDDRSRKAVEVAERYADGKAMKKELADAAFAAYDAACDADAAAYAAYDAAWADARAAAYTAACDAYLAACAANNAQVRMVAELGNPFKKESPTSEPKYTRNIRYYGTIGDVIVETDGDMRCAHFADFANLQESDCAFSTTDIDAVANLALAMRDKSPDGSPCLIAAAPELMAALEAAREFIADGMAMGFVGMPEDETVLEVIEKTIRKANGEVKE